MSIICPNCKKELTELNLVLQKIYVIFYEKETKIDLTEEKVNNKEVATYIDEKVKNWNKYGDTEPEDIILKVRCPYCNELLGEFDPNSKIEEIRKNLEEKFGETF